MKDRILQIIETEGLTAAKFAQEIGVQPSSISHIVSGRNKASVDLITKILHRYPGISTDWLMLGKGEMNKSDVDRPASSPESQNATPNLFDQSSKQGGRTETQHSKAHENQPPAPQPFSGEENTPEPRPDKGHQNKAVEKILVFYSDKTFSTYFPS